MRLALLFCVLPVIGAEPPGYKYWSAAELKTFSTTQRLADFGNHYGMVVHRDGSGEAEFHGTDAELFVVLSGSATLIVGGTIPNGKTTAPGEVRGASIDGGTRQAISAGDIVHIPSKTAHRILLDTGGQVTSFMVKVKE